MDRLVGVKPNLIYVAQRALELSSVDFGIVEGLRTIEAQRKNVASGASQTMNSKHLTGNAIDIVAYLGSSVVWEEKYYPPIADAFKQAAIDLDVHILWGGAWTVPDIRKWPASMYDAMMSYANARRAQGQKPFLDLGHFELVE